MTDLVAEFTIEPFEPSAPGPHVLAAIEAAQADSAGGLSCEIGPFGTSVTGASHLVLDRVRIISEAAFANGASRVSLQISAI